MIENSFFDMFEVKNVAITDESSWAWSYKLDFPYVVEITYGEHGILGDPNDPIWVGVVRDVDEYLYDEGQDGIVDHSEMGTLSDVWDWSINIIETANKRLSQEGYSKLKNRYEQDLPPTWESLGVTLIEQED
tara:strand:+ start:2377 stop:2772 length:396 start_codon:yes stop_codon:yes gene_type:complete